MNLVRLRRLHADFLRLQDYVKRHPRLQLIQTEGDPPERYQLQYDIRSLRQKGEKLVEARDHLVEVTLPRDYPRVPPLCRMLTPVFHPNIAPHAICIGDHWSAGEPLSAIVARIGELLAYQSYNTKSPLNGEAARWVSEHLDALPLDSVSMVLDDLASPPAPPPLDPPSVLPADPTPEPPPLRPAANIEFHCPQCGSMLAVPRTSAGKRARCPRCKAITVIPVT